MHVKQTMIWLVLFLSFLKVFPQNKVTDILFETPGYDFQYNLAEPDKTWKLPNALLEISGLGYADTQRLACVQDEQGVVFIFNLNTGKVDLEIYFGDDGDYEGVEIVKNDAWIIKSNGTLYRVTDYLKKSEQSVKKYTTDLSGKNNTEGLAYDPFNKNLLIVCKGYPFVAEKKESGFKAIYSFNIETKLLDIKPFLLINLDTLRYYKNYDAMTTLGVKILDYLDPSEGDKTFQPSGIAIQPVTGNVFILASVGKLLLVLSGKGEMLAMIKLRENIFPQPEGICFSPDGTLYISNEGVGQEGTILEFTPKYK
jgi:uncharacterized protein YjiK